MDLDRLLKFMTDKGASDLHLKPTRPPLLRINGRLMPIEAPPLKPDELTEMLPGILTPRQKTKLEERMSVDIGYGVRGLARFRGNIYMQRGNIAACFRRIPYQIKSVEDLELPPVLLDFCELPMGLVLVTGPTGSGKSTTLAALIRYITMRRPGARDHHRGPDGVPVHGRRGLDLPARGGDGHGHLLRGAAQRHAAGPGRHHGGRDARPGDRVDRDHRGRDRPPGLLDPPHQQRAADGRPHPRHLPGRPAGPGPRPARADPEGRRLDEAGRAGTTARAGWRRSRSCAPRRRSTR